MDLRVDEVLLGRHPERRFGADRGNQVVIVDTLVRELDLYPPVLRMAANARANVNGLLLCAELLLRAKDLQITNSLNQIDRTREECLLHPCPGHWSDFREAHWLRIRGILAHL